MQLPSADELRKAARLIRKAARILETAQPETALHLKQIRKQLRRRAILVEAAQDD
jgi:hypothetical protein